MRFVQVFFYKLLAISASLFNDRELAISYWQKIALLLPRDARAPAVMAHLRAELGQNNEALVLIKSSLELDSTKALTWYNLGFLNNEMLVHADALNAFDRAIEIAPNMDLAYYGKSLALIKLGRVEEAIAPLKRNTELQPLSPYGWYQLAHAYNRLGHVDKAEKTIAWLSRFEPSVAMQLRREMGLNATR